MSAGFRVKFNFLPAVKNIYSDRFIKGSLLLRAGGTRHHSLSPFECDEIKESEAGSAFFFTSAVVSSSTDAGTLPGLRANSLTPPSFLC